MGLLTSHCAVEVTRKPIAQATVIQANGTAEAIRIVIQQLNVTGNATQALEAFLTMQWYDMLQNPETAIQWIIINPDASPIIIKLEEIGD